MRRLRLARSLVDLMTQIYEGMTEADHERMRQLMDEERERRLAREG